MQTLLTPPYRDAQPCDHLTPLDEESPVPLLREGETIRDTYCVERFLGEGAFAEVYRVEHRFLGRQAMKVFKTSGTALADIEQMLSEALLLSRIGHPNIIRVFDANTLQTEGGTFGFFTMEYVAGGSLDRLWRSCGNTLMSVAEAVEIMRQVCAGLAVAHAEEPPIVHRDIKPQNILIGYEGTDLRVRVSDFGLAKRANPLTLLVSARGTLAFKPPEAFENQDSPAADVWAVGTTLYLLLTDARPFPQLDGRDIADCTRFVPTLRPASIYNMAVDPALDSILFRCLEKIPEERYPDALALLADLHHWQGSELDHQASARGAHSQPPPADRTAAAQRASRAVELAKQPGKLTVAVDLLEEAVRQAPHLQDRYAAQLKLWRQGVCM